MRIKAWLIWALASFFYLYELVLRIAPAAMVDDLMASLKITAEGIGFLGAAYYIAYTPMQLPVGILMDCFGARILLAIACVFCSIGSCGFALSDQYMTLLLFRLVIGLGSAFAWVGLIFIISHWFRSTKTAVMIGLGSSIGMLGGIFGQGPLASIVQTIGYKQAMWFLGIFGLVLTFCIFIFIKDDPKISFHHTTKENKQITKKAVGAIKRVWSNQEMWKVALYSVLIYSSTAVFAELWGISFLTSKYGIDKSIAGGGTSLIYLGWLIGSPMTGFISGILRKRRPLLIFGAFGTTCCIALIILVKEISLSTTFLLLFLFGLFSSVQLLTFSIAVEINPRYAKGTAGALNNFVTMIGGLLMQPIVGWFLNLSWDGTMQKNIPFYSFNNFRWALMVLPIMCFLGFLLSFNIKETHCKPIDSHK
jgi:sugar phosphate permease